MYILLILPDFHFIIEIKVKWTSRAFWEGVLLGGVWEQGKLIRDLVLRLFDEPR